LQIKAPHHDILGELSALEIGAHIRKGDFTALEAVTAAIGRLQAVEPHLGGVACDRSEAALAEAAALNPLETTAVFAGVPSLIKDNTDMVGLPTGHGSRATSSRPAGKDAALTRLFQATGLIPIAKTCLPEFGLTATTERTGNPPTRNPWNPAFSSGGSSGGSAALVAAGVSPIAHANDGGGSTRIPAACCGLVGLKASRNRLPTAALAKGLPINLIAEGVVSRSVADTAAYYAEVERHFTCPDLPPIGRVTNPGKARLRIALVAEHPLGGRCDDDVTAVLQSVGLCCEALGHNVELAPSMVTAEMADDFFLYWARLAAAAQYLGGFALGPGFDRHKLEPLTYGLSHHYLRNIWRSPGAIHRLRKFGKNYQRQFEQYELILTPVLATPPVEIGFLAPDLDFATAVERLRHYSVFTPPQNVSGTPAIALPLGTSSRGLPVGVQFAAAMGQEARLLEVAYELEQAMPWSYPAPLRAQ